MSEIQSTDLFLVQRGDSLYSLETTSKSIEDSIDPTDLLEVLKTKELALEPEQNYTGQFAAHLRQLGVQALPLSQYTGLPWRVSDLKDAIRSKI